jgi:hypothetical protein
MHAWVFLFSFYRMPRVFRSSKHGLLPKGRERSGRAFLDGSMIHKVSIKLKFCADHVLKQRDDGSIVCLYLLLSTTIIAPAGIMDILTVTG